MGHDQVRLSLEAHLPHVVLLFGPPSVGKRTMAFHVADAHKVHVLDRLWVDSLRRDQSTEIKKFALSSPACGRLKMVIARLDGASETALNAMLKVLEEPPPSTKFVLLLAGRTLDTIYSRCQMYRMGLLSQEDLLLVLTVELGMDARVAERSVRRADGTVASAMQAGDSDQVRNSVLSALKAVADSDKVLLNNALKQWRDEDGTLHGWTDGAFELLQRWATEALTGRWRVFSDAETFGLAGDGEVPRLILSKIDSVRHANGRLASRVVLESVLEARR